MSALERALYRRRTMLFVVAAILFLGGAVAVAFIEIGHESDRADGLASNLTKTKTEADLRGSAVSTLAGDVRALRSQVQAAGKTPVAPDPAKAITNLPDRAAVPVPIPGPPGPKGDKGATGASASPGPAGHAGADSTVPGPQGSPGTAGVQGDPGPAGQAGQDGKDGTNGKDGANGAPPAGWTYTDPSGQSYTCGPVDNFDASAPRYTCTADTTAAPTGSATSSGLAGVGMLIASAAYRRLP